MEKILITMALKELKILDSKITKILSNKTFVSAAKTSDKNVNSSLTKEQFKREAIADFQSVNDLIKRREKIKSAIVQSNAETNIEICGETISVAKAIDLKISINYREMFLSEMRRQLAECEHKIQILNENMEKTINKMVQNAYNVSSVDNIPEEDIEKISGPYKKFNEMGLIDPIDIKTKIETEIKYIQEFKQKIDLRLQASNCITYIKI